MNDKFYLRRALELAKKGHGSTWPNPMVGAVIVKNGKIIGEGHHSRSGEDHAEIVALKTCTESPEGATIYVNLEPCCHTNKRTPPCAQKLIAEKISKVVITNLDPNPEVNGKGVELLRQNGIEVVYGELEKEGERLNEVFFLSQRKKRPFIHLKLASTLDGKTALMSGESQWITGDEARREVQRMRSTHQGVIIGAETARKDNPKLNVRLESFKREQPLRIIFSQSGNLDPKLQLFSDELKSRTLVYSVQPLPFDFPGARRVESLEEALEDLYEKKVVSLLLEGGSKLAASFMRSGLIDRVSLFMNPSFLGAGTSTLGDLGVHSLKARPRLSEVETQFFGEDLLFTGRLL